VSDHTFCRGQLAETLKEVRVYLSPKEIKEAWGYRPASFKDTVEFHFRDFYWHGSGCCIAIAKAEGWDAWLKQHHPRRRPSGSW
jgi:hypothetical protein